MLDNDVLKCKITANAHYDPRSAEIIARNSSLNFHQFFYGGCGGGVKFLLELFLYDSLLDLTLKKIL